MYHPPQMAFSIFAAAHFPIPPFSGRRTRPQHFSVLRLLFWHFLQRFN